MPHGEVPQWQAKRALLHIEVFAIWPPGMPLWQVWLLAKHWANRGAAKVQVTRKISEAFQINTLGGNCISAPLIELHELLFECSWWWFCGKGPARAPFNWLWRFPAFNLFNKFSRTSLPTSTLSVFLCAISINKTAIQTQRILINNVFIHVGHSMMATFSLRACRHWRLSCPQVCRIGERSSPVQFSFRLRTH